MSLRILCLLLTLTLIGCDRQDADWEQARQQDTIAAYESFIDSYPESDLAEQARDRLATLRAEQAWTNAQRLDTIAAYQDFLQTHPDAAGTDEARARLENLQREARWRELSDSDDVEALRSFADNHAGSAEAELARSRAEELEARAAAEAERLAQQQRELERQREAQRLAAQGTHRVQLAVVRGQDRANAGIELLAGQLGSVLGDVKLEAQQTNGLYRLVTQPLPRQRANDLCQTLKQAGQDCLVRDR